MYVRLRPRWSDAEDQAKRPAMFASDNSPTKPAAAPAPIVPGNIS